MKEQSWQRLKRLADVPSAFGPWDDQSWSNYLYHVLRRERGPNLLPGMVHLSVKRHDREPIRDWRHMQQVKNELCGDEWTGLEVYPPMSNLADSANQYHVWCLEAALPFGLEGHLVTDDLAVGNARQRSFDPGLRWEKTGADELEEVRRTAEALLGRRP